MPSGAQLGQVRGRPLVGGHQLIDLRTGQVPATPDQPVEPIPFRPMGGGKRINVHGRRLLPEPR